MGKDDQERGTPLQNREKLPTQKEEMLITVRNRLTGTGALWL